MKRGLAATLCSLLATATLACVNLKKPAAVAECENTGTCEQVDAPVVSPPSDGGDRDLPASSDAAKDGLRDDTADVPADRPSGSTDGGILDVVAGACWTAKGPVAVGTECRPSVGLCDVPEVCDGINPNCPPDKFSLGDTICRKAAGGCDLPESCSGSSPECPADVLRSPGAICRDSLGPCDVAESCSGTDPNCPEDRLTPAQTECHVSKDGNTCDPAETCTGTDVACPDDIWYTKPTAPASIKAEAGVLQAGISWAAVTVPAVPGVPGVPKVIGYNVKRSNSRGSGYTLQGSPPTVKETSYLSKGLTGGSTYYYVVTAINAIPTCESDSSVEVSAKPTGVCVPPPVPTVTATPSNGQIALSWTASAGASSYTVARSTTSGTGYASIAVVTTGTSYVDLGVSNGTTYYYVVSASNESCSSLDSFEVSSSPTCTPPAPPTNLAATPSNGSVALSWKATPGAVSYRILRSNVAGSDYKQVGTSGTTSYTDTTVINGTIYYYVVTASNGTCNSVNSNQASAAPACVPPSVPANVVATPGNSQAVLSWNPSSGGATSYEVSRSTTAGGPYALAGKPTSAGFTDTKLVNGTTYYYVVTASNGACISGPSVQVSVTPVCTPPGLPTSMKATPGDGKVSLSWTASTNGATSYTVSRAEGTGAYANLGAPVTTTSFTDSTAVNGHTYSYVVSASNGTCSSDNTAAVTATPVAVCTQAAPTGLTATAVSQKVTLNWTAAAGATDYDISRSATAGSGYAAVGTVTAPTTTFVDTDTNLKIGSTYYYVVTANNANCSSPNSAEVSVTVVCTPPTAPASVSASASTTDGSVTISWATIADATGYTVSRSTSSGGTYTPISSNQTAVTYKDTGCASGTTCYYIVRASNVGGTCVSADSTVVAGAACKLPGVPTGLSKTVGVPPGSGKVLLTWTAASNADSYEILRSTSSSTGYASFTDNTTTTTSLTDSGLSNDTSYYYVVRARNGGASCASANSAEIRAIPRACQVLPGSRVNITLDAAATCFVTCWDMAALTWNCSSFDASSRGITVNGRSVSCGGDPGAKANGAYTFSIAAGTHSYDSMAWWSNGVTIQPHDCE